MGREDEEDGGDGDSSNTVTLLAYMYTLYECHTVICPQLSAVVCVDRHSAFFDLNLATSYSITYRRSHF